jgi:hypothetical protein
MFDASAPNPAQSFADAVHARVANDIAVRMPSAMGETSAYCYRRAAWNCKTMQCSDALRMAYNTTSCLDSYSENVYLDPCGHPELFDLRDRVEISLDTLKGGPTDGIEKYMERTLQRFLDAAQRVAATVVRYNDYHNLKFCSDSIAHRSSRT